MKLMIYTQIHENYGAHCWDGKGECPQYWKAKGGNEYAVQNVSLNLNRGDVAAQVRALVAAVEPQIECNDESFREYVIDWAIEADDFKTPYELSQEEYGERHVYRPKPLQVAA